MWNQNDAMQYIQSCRDELLALIRELCEIPAPSHHEERRAAFCKAWLEAAGARDVQIDEAKNVVCPVGVEDGAQVAVFMAHTDTVFPDLEPMPFVAAADGRWCCPGIGDDTANLAVLLLCARYAIRNGGKNLLFVANSCEEGLGNLKGSRQLMADWGSRTCEVVSFDGYAESITNRAVGSTRYRVEICTEGGHSFENFGNRNAIAVLASMVQTLYNVKVPDGGKTTYNVGAISGGTSVNTIAQQAEMLYEYRSDVYEHLETMRRMFEAVVEAYRAMGVTVNVEVLGQRPCANGVDAARERALTERCQTAIEAVYGRRAPEVCASTDCNIPLSLGIPAISTGVCRGDGAHTREEYIWPDSLEDGFRVAMALVSHYMH